MLYCAQRASLGSSSGAGSRLRSRDKDRSGGSDASACGHLSLPNWTLEFPQWGRAPTYPEKRTRPCMAKQKPKEYKGLAKRRGASEVMQIAHGKVRLYRAVKRSKSLLRLFLSYTAPRPLGFHKMNLTVSHTPAPNRIPSKEG